MASPLGELSPPALPRLLADSTNERWPRGYERRTLAALAHPYTSLRGRNLRHKATQAWLPSFMRAVSPFGGAARARATTRGLSELENSIVAHVATSARNRRAARTRGEHLKHTKTGQVPSFALPPARIKERGRDSNPRSSRLKYRCHTTKLQRHQYCSTRPQADNIESVWSSEGRSAMLVATPAAQCRDPATSA